MLGRKYLLLACMIFVSLFPPYLCRAADQGAVFPFLEIQDAANPLSLAGAYTAWADDINALRWNPAGLGTLEDQGLQFSYLNYIADIQSGSLSYAGNGLGLGLAYMNYGAIPEDTGTEPPGTSFPMTYPYSLAVTLGYGVYLTKGLWVGASLTGLQEKISEFTSRGVSCDLGLLYLPDAIAPLGLGFCVKNLGLQTKPFVEEQGRLPTNLVLGLALPLWESAVRLSADGVFNPDRRRPEYNLGAEYNWNHLLQARGGYRSAGTDLNTGGSNDILNGFCFGFGLRVGGYEFDYAYAPFSQLGSTHRVSLVFAWGADEDSTANARLKTPARSTESFSPGKKSARLTPVKKSTSRLKHKPLKPKTLKGAKSKKIKADPKKKKKKPKKAALIKIETIATSKDSQ